jgi:hypothetical protein
MTDKESSEEDHIEDSEETEIGSEATQTPIASDTTPHNFWTKLEMPSFDAFTHEHDEEHFLEDHSLATANNVVSNYHARLWMNSRICYPQPDQHQTRRVHQTALNLVLAITMEFLSLVITILLNEGPTLHSIPIKTRGPLQSVHPSLNQVN